MKQLPDWYLYRTVSRGELSRWCRGLKIFRFFRAVGGFAADGDKLVARIKIPHESELNRVCTMLGIPLQETSGKGPDGMPDSIPGFDRYQQIGHTTISGVPAFVWVHRDHMLIDLSGAGGDPYSVTDKDYENALTLEKTFASLDLEFTDPPEESANCITPKLYPEFWK